MAESYQVFTGLSGATSVSFTKPFLATTHLSVEDDGVVMSSGYTVDPTPASPPFTGATITFSPAVSGTIKVLRNTPVPSGALYKDFTDGGVLKASDLDDIQRYHGYRAQEEAEQARKPVAAADVGLTVQGLTSQVGDLQQWIDVAGVVKANLDKDGNAYFGANTLCIRQIVAATLTGSNNAITDDTTYRMTGIKFVVTPKLSTSYLLFVGATRVNAVDTSGTNVGWSDTLYKNPTGSPSQGDALAGGTEFPAAEQRHAVTGDELTGVTLGWTAPIFFMTPSAATSAATYVYGVQAHSTGDTVTVEAATSYSWGYVIEIG